MVKSEGRAGRGGGGRVCGPPSPEIIFIRGSNSECDERTQSSNSVILFLRQMVQSLLTMAL